MLVGKIPKFKKEDMEINYLKEGKGEPLILIMGFGSQMKGWSFQVEFFKDKMTVISLDNRGTGTSSRPNYPYTMDMFVEDIKNLLDYLNIQEKIHLCGISMGGMIAQHFVLKHPERVKTLILLATTAQQHSSPLTDMDDAIKKTYSDPEAMFKTRLISLYSFSFRKKLKKDKQLYEQIRNVIVENPTLFQDYVNQSAAISGHSTIDSLHEITQPTLIMAGNKDKLIGFQESEIIHEKILSSRLEIIEGVGHGFIVEAADKVNESMWNFIKEYSV